MKKPRKPRKKESRPRNVSPEIRAARSANMRAKNANPEYRAKQLSGMRNPKYRALRRQMMLAQLPKHPNLKFYHKLRRIMGAEKAREEMHRLNLSEDVSFRREQLPESSPVIRRLGQRPSNNPVTPE